MAILFNLMGAGFAFAAWVYSESNKLPLLIIAAVLCFGLAFCVAPRKGGSGADCYIDWDGRSNSEVCD